MDWGLEVGEDHGVRVRAGGGVEIGELSEVGVGARVRAGAGAGAGAGAVSITGAHILRPPVPAPASITERAHYSVLGARQVSCS